ncbi:transcription termination/antitermination protein NusG [Thermosporothrix hazakensis]|jgi:transcription antitermination factor NusG|nr:hypothetical protein [Thermosporothrix hazakensis]
MTNLKPGDRVRVTYGPLSFHQGTVIRVDERNHQVTVSLPTLIGKKNVKVDFLQVQKI